MQGFRVARDAMDRHTDIISTADHRCVLVLQPGSQKSLVVPNEASILIISATSDVWVNFGGAATLPDADITDGTASELNPGARLVNGGSSIGVVSASACLVNFIFYGGGSL